MESKIKEEVNSKYPCLMKSRWTNKVVLFIADEVGTVIYTGDKKEDIGYQHTSFNMSSFEPFNGKVELSN